MMSGKGKHVSFSDTTEESTTGEVSMFPYRTAAKHRHAGTKSSKRKSRGSADPKLPPASNMNGSTSTGGSDVHSNADRAYGTERSSSKFRFPSFELKFRGSKKEAATTIGTCKSEDEVIMAYDDPSEVSHQRRRHITSITADADQQLTQYPQIMQILHPTRNSPQATESMEALQQEQPVESFDKFTQTPPLSAPLSTMSSSDNSPVHTFTCAMNGVVAGQLQSGTTKQSNQDGTLKPDLLVENVLENSSDNDPLLKAAREGDFNALKRLSIEYGNAIYRTRDSAGCTCLHLCVQRGNMAAVQHLCSTYPPLVEVENKAKMTSAYLAVKHGEEEILDWLLKNTRLNELIEREPVRQTLVHGAAKYGQDSCLRLLLDTVGRSMGKSHPDDLLASSKTSTDMPDFTDASLNTPAHAAAKHGHIACLQTLVEYGVDVTRQNRHGYTPCYYADFSNHRDCARYLVVIETALMAIGELLETAKTSVPDLRKTTDFSSASSIWERTRASMRTSFLSEPKAEVDTVAREKCKAKAWAMLGPKLVSACEQLVVCRTKVAPIQQQTVIKPDNLNTPLPNDSTSETQPISESTIGLPFETHHVISEDQISSWETNLDAHLTQEAPLNDTSSVNPNTSDDSRHYITEAEIHSTQIPETDMPKTNATATNTFITAVDKTRDQVDFQKASSVSNSPPPPLPPRLSRQDSQTVIQNMYNSLLFTNFPTDQQGIPTMYSSVVSNIKSIDIKSPVYPEITSQNGGSTASEPNVIEDTYTLKTHNAIETHVINDVKTIPDEQNVTTGQESTGVDCVNGGDSYVTKQCVNEIESVATSAYTLQRGDNVLDIAETSFIEDETDVYKERIQVDTHDTDTDKESCIIQEDMRNESETKLPRRPSSFHEDQPVIEMIVEDDTVSVTSDTHHRWLQDILAVHKPVTGERYRSPLLKNVATDDPVKSKEAPEITSSAPNVPKLRRSATLASLDKLGQTDTDTNDTRLPSSTSLYAFTPHTPGRINVYSQSNASNEALTEFKSSSKDQHKMESNVGTNLRENDDETIGVDVAPKQDDTRSKAIVYETDIDADLNLPTSKPSVDAHVNQLQARLLATSEKNISPTIQEHTKVLLEHLARYNSSSPDRNANASFSTFGVGGPKQSSPLVISSEDEGNAGKVIDIEQLASEIANLSIISSHKTPSPNGSGSSQEHSYYIDSDSLPSGVGRQDYYATTELNAQILRHILDLHAASTSTDANNTAAMKANARAITPKLIKLSDAEFMESYARPVDPGKGNNGNNNNNLAKLGNVRTSGSMLDFGQHFISSTNAISELTHHNDFGNNRTKHEQGNKTRWATNGHDSMGRLGNMHRDSVRKFGARRHSAHFAHAMKHGKTGQFMQSVVENKQLGRTSNMDTPVRHVSKGPEAIDPESRILDNVISTSGPDLASDMYQYSTVFTARGENSQSK